MKQLFAGLCALALTAPAAPAQRIQSFGPELRGFVAAYVPMGAMRDDFRDAASVGGQAAMEISDHWHMLGTIGWTYGKNRMAGLAKEKTYLIHYDIGAESNLLYELSSEWLFKPFGGVGVGARSYDYGANGSNTTTCSAGYGAIGAEVQRGGLALRTEARQYVSCFESPVTGEKKTRSDGLFGFGLAYHIR